MVIGKILGKTIIDAREHRATTHDLTSKLLAQFTKEFGTINCDDLTGVNMSNKDEFAKAFEKGVFRETCPSSLKRQSKFSLSYFPAS